MNSTILIVEDHDSVRNSLRNWLSVVFPNYRFAEAKSGEEAVDAVLSQVPELVLMDIGLPGMKGIEATRMIKTIVPETKVVMLTIHEDPRYEADALAAGANGYVSKRKIHSELIPVLMRLLDQPVRNAGLTLVRK
jgi:two-component system, NarL family, invasion response regulator UvrY